MVKIIQKYSFVALIIGIWLHIASGTSFAQTPTCTNTLPTASQSVARVDLTSATLDPGTYSIWTRIRIAQGATLSSPINATYVLEVDNNCVYYIGGSPAITSTNTNGQWVWVNYANGLTSSVVTQTFSSSATHLFSLIGNNSGVQIDRLLVTQDQTCIPTGTGDNCANAVTITPTAGPTPTGFPVTPSTIKNKAGMNVEPGLRPWRYSGANPDGWFCSSPNCYTGDPTNTYQTTSPQAMIDREMQLISNLGIGLLRIEFDWPLIETANGVYDFSRTDYIVNEANKYNIQLQPILVFTPSWAGANTTVSPTNNADWTNFVTTMVNRYKNSVHYWEMWNEPDGGHYWNDGDQKYVQNILMPGYSAAKAADPNTFVLLGEPASANSTFYNDVYAFGGGNSFDIAGFHEYGNPTGPQGDISTVQNILNSHSQGTKPLWIGEYGFTESSNTTADNGHINAINGTLGSATGYQEAIFYNLRDDYPMTDPTTIVNPNYFGLVQHDDITLKQGYTTMQTLVSGRNGNPTPTVGPSPTTGPTPTVAPQSVSSLTLVNAQTHTDVSTMSNGMTVDLSTLPAACLNIRANTSPSTVGSVVFGFDGNSSYHTENNAPYYIGNDTSGVANCWAVSAGQHTVSATPFSSTNGTGTQGTGISLTFTAMNGVPTNTPVPPSATPTTVQPSFTPTPTPVPGDANGDGHVNIFDLSTLASQYNQCAPNLSADFNHDGCVNVLDMSVIGSNWGI